MGNGQEHPGQDAQDLIRLSGLKLTSDERAELEVLIRRFAADRALLAGVETGDLEPAVLFAPPVSEEDLT